MKFIIEVSYLLAATLFILGLKQMSSPVTARRGIHWAGYGMLLATGVTFFAHEITSNTNVLTNIALIVAAIALGGGYAWHSGKRVAMTDMPQMIAMYNGMGGGAAATIAAVELLKAQSETDLTTANNIGAQSSTVVSTATSFSRSNSSSI